MIKTDCFAYRAANGRKWCDCCKGEKLYCKEEKCAHYKTKAQYERELIKYGSNIKVDETPKPTNRKNAACVIDVEYIKAMMETRGIKVSELSGLCGVGRTTIHNIFRRGKANKKLVKKIADTLDVPEFSLRRN